MAEVSILLILSLLKNFIFFTLTFHFKTPVIATIKFFIHLKSILLQILLRKYFTLSIYLKKNKQTKENPTEFELKI